MDSFHYSSHFASNSDSFGYDMSWWKEEHFNASDVDADGWSTKLSRVQ
ncbi:unnamed protein product [Trifolium pratense]|uniref:Uncharacterized protein n=1 Tax=Trifolium pratense TaxID=57577 RepID=A0ACB0L3S2_TRIPR|nr:unnamed protein product [Trifolium pratense]